MIYFAGGAKWTFSRILVSSDERLRAEKGRIDVNSLKINFFIQMLQRKISNIQRRVQLPDRVSCVLSPLANGGHSFFLKGSFQIDYFDSDRCLWACNFGINCLWFFILNFNWLWCSRFWDCLINPFANIDNCLPRKNLFYILWLESIAKKLRLLSSRWGLLDDRILFYSILMVFSWECDRTSLVLLW